VVLKFELEALARRPVSFALVKNLAFMRGKWDKTEQVLTKEAFTLLSFWRE
jgi:hypothetical protein